jgi:hypothetical protein
MAYTGVPTRPDLRPARRRWPTFVATAAVLVAALPLAAAPGGAVSPLEPMCAGGYVGDIAEPSSTFPAGVLPRTTGYTSFSPVLSGQNAIKVDLGNTQPNGVRFSANLKMSATPAINTAINGHPNQSVSGAYAYLKVSWRNSPDHPAHPSASPGIPTGVGPLKPTVEIGERYPALPAGTDKVVIGRGTVNETAAAGTSLANVSTDTIIETVAHVRGVVDPLVPVILGSVNLSYKSTYFPTRQALIAIFPSSAAELWRVPFFVALANNAFASLDPSFVRVDPDIFGSCSPVGLLYIACAYDLDYVPPGLEPICQFLS